MIPMMTPEEVDFLASKLSPTDHVFEYGAGSSTLWLRNRVARVTSVEHDAVWASTVILNIRTAGVLGVEVHFVPTDRPWDGHGDGDLETFDSYVRALKPCSARPYDVILIDGRARVDCAKRVAALRAGRAVFLHDCERVEYAPVWTEHLQEMQRVGNLMMLRPR